MLLAQSAPLLNELQCLALIFIILALTGTMVFIAAIKQGDDPSEDE